MTKTLLTLGCRFGGVSVSWGVFPWMMRAEQPINSPLDRQSDCANRGLIMSKAGLPWDHIQCFEQTKLAGFQSDRYGNGSVTCAAFSTAREKERIMDPGSSLTLSACHAGGRR